MLSEEDNELMCRVGPRTAMGAAMRRYWLPALEAAELPGPDCDPVHVELLGEHFVAFRDSQGRAGLLDELCCHRGASLLLGRVEDGGIRCLYHGWKFAVDGTVLETPNVPDVKFKTRIRARAYAVREAGGLIWAYLGPAEKCPPFPDYPWLKLPASHRLVVMHWVESSFVQVLEGLVDSSHLNILHADGLRASSGSRLGFANKVELMQRDAAPRLEAETTEFGFHYAALRSSASASGPIRARVTAFIAPCTVLNPNGDIATMVVPRNDTSSLFYHVFWDENRAIGEEPLRSEQLRFVGLDRATRGSFGLGPPHNAKEPARANRYNQSRESMRVSFTGLPGLIEEDVAVSISPGPIRDRTREALSIADLAVGQLYRVLIACARAGAEGSDPIAAQLDVRQIRGIQGDLADGKAWQTLVPHHYRRSGSAA